MSGISMKSDLQQPAKLDPVSTQRTTPQGSARSPKMSAFSFSRPAGGQQQQQNGNGSSDSPKGQPGGKSSSQKALQSQPMSSPGAAMLDGTAEATAWKERGNAAFKQGRWAAAVEAYTR